jgi:hypothetical protein
VRQLAAARGFEPVIYEEVESAAKARPVLDRMLADVRAGRVHAVAVWALDRLHRSMASAINTVLELDRLGVPVLPVREGWLDTSGPVRRAIPRTPAPSLVASDALQALVAIVVWRCRAARRMGPSLVVVVRSLVPRPAG